MSRTVCDAIVDTLADIGVREILGVPGDAINNLIDALRRNGDVRFVQVRHEEAGAFAASARAKLTGQLAVCCGTSGPGAVHLLNGLYDAKVDHAPVLAITGQVETAELGHDYHQEIDLKTLFSDVTVYNATLTNVEHAPRIITAACQAAITRRGVAHISIPRDLAGATTNDDNYPVLVDHPQLLPAESHLQKAADILNAHHNIAILAGLGALRARDQVVRLAERINAPIIHSLKAKELLPDDHPFNAGGIGLLGGRPGVEAISDCDCLLMLGTDFPYRDFLPRGIPVIQVDREPEHLGRRCPLALGLAGDVKPTLDALLPLLKAQTENSFLSTIQAHRSRQHHHYDEREHKATTPIQPPRLSRLVGDLARDDAIFVCDTGEVTVWNARHLRLRGEQRFTLSGNLASMAFGLPGTLGAQLAYPDRQIIGLCGDGGFSMLMADLLTAVKYELPVKLVVFSNHKLGLIQVEQESEGLPEYAIGLQDLDFAAFARLCGADGFKVTEDNALESTLREAFDSPKPAVIDVQLDGDALPFPPRIKVEQAFKFGIAKLKEMFSHMGE